MESAIKYMVPASEIKGDTIEKCWIPLWNKVSRTPMSKEDTKYFLHIMMMDDKDAKDIVEKCLADEDFMAQIIHKSMKSRFSMDLDWKLTLWLIISLTTPGEAVMVFAYLKWQMKQKDLTKMTFNDYIRIFPFGFPTKDEMQWLWECQKIRCESDEEREWTPGTGNLLDYGPAYASITNKSE